MAAPLPSSSTESDLIRSHRLWKVEHQVERRYWKKRLLKNAARDVVERELRALFTVRRVLVSVALALLLPAS